MIHLRRMFMISAALIAINMQGCSCDDDNDKYYPPPPQQSSVSVEGTTSKGLLRGFVVSAHEIAENGDIGDQPVATATTNNLGFYRLSIPSSLSDRPYLIRVTPAASGSTMLCDMELGCGEAGFGDPVPVAADSGFELSALVPSAPDGTIANITLFSHVAAELAMDSVEGTGLNAIRTAIATANSQVANRFGIVGDLTSIPVIDLTNPAAVTAAMTNGESLYVRYSAINAAIISAVISDNLNFSVASALSSFVNNYLDLGLAGNVDDETETSLGEILQYAERALRLAQENLGAQTQVNLAGLIQALSAEAQLALSEEPGQYDQGTPSDTTGATPRAKAVAMVGDLRDLLFSFGEVTVEDGTLGSIAEDFALQIEAAELAASDDLGLLVEAMALAASAVDDANRAYESNNEIESYTSDNGITVAITTENDAPVYEVDETVEVNDTDVAVTLTARNALELTPGSQASPGTVLDGSYAVTGSAEIPSLVMTVGEGSWATVDQYVSTGSAMTETHTLAGLDLSLRVTIAQQNVTDAVGLNGHLAVSLADASLNEETTVGQTGEAEVTEFNVGVVSFQFYGNVSNSTGEAANFSLSLSGDGTGVSLVETWVNGTTSLESETETNFADLHGSLLFTAKLTGNPNVVVMNYGLARTGLNSADNTLSIKYPGKQFSFNLAVEDGEPEGYLTVVNQDGVTLRIREGATQVEGDVSYAGTTYGVIEERADNVVVRFPSSDGDDLVTLY